MTSPTPFELSDVAIERMLASRAGSGAPDELVAGIVAAANATSQRRRSLLPPFALPRPGGHRALLVAAGAALLLVPLAAALIGGLIRLTPPPPTLPPLIVASPSPTTSSTPTSTPVGSPSPTATRAGAGLLVVYQVRDTFIDLYTLDPFTGEKVPLGNLQKTSDAMGQAIRWSADRKHAFVFADGEAVQAFVDVEQRTLETLPIGESGGRDAVSPAGDLVARLDGDAEHGSLVIVDLDGTEVQRVPLTPGLQPFINLAWSPDGTSILVSGCVPCDEAPPRHDHLFIVPLDGGPIRQLTDRTTGFFGSARWSPDMTSITYTDSDCGVDPCSGGIGTVRVQDGHVTGLTDGGDSKPAWSPDGHRIAFERAAGASKGIYVMDADGGNLIRLTTSPTARGDRAPFWSPDGAWIVFSRGTSETDLGDLYIVSSAGGEPRLLERNAVADW
jgi:dipeptidyl aminopeptidase/acylaminoacyl peptidase